MALKPIKQSQFLRGVNASVAYNSQPKGTVPRLSNMLFTSRGALRSSDQNMGICTLNGTGPLTGAPPFLSIQFFQPSPMLRKILALQNSPVGTLTAPTGLAAVLASGGSLTSGTTYYYVVTAIDSGGGETIASSEVNATPSGGNLTVDLTWTAVTGAVSYNVYRSTSTNTEVLLTGAGLPATTNSYTDDGSATVAATVFTIISASVEYYYYPGYPPYVRPTFATVFQFVLTTDPTSGSIGSFTVTGNSYAPFNMTYPYGSVSGNTVTYANTLWRFWSNHRHRRHSHHCKWRWHPPPNLGHWAATRTP